LEVSLRGYRLPKASRKLDVVLVAVRYDARGKQLAYSQAYVRRGKVWGDLTLLDRGELIERLEEEQQVVTGKPAQIPGEFTVFDRVRLERNNGSEAIRVGETRSKEDDLGLPLF
jgi:hypothetical protein